LHATSSKELLLHGVDKELRPNANPSDEELTVLNVVREWITLREHSDAEGAANLSTSDIVVRTPLGAVRGLKRGACKRGAEPARMKAPSARAARAPPPLTPA
jgi:hypothetical protein